MVMPRIVVPAGTRFGKLTVIGEGPPLGKRNERSLHCRCDCGQETTPLLSNLRKESGTRSCGCDKKAVLVAQQNAGRSHGMRHARVYGIWHSMKQRCLNPNAKEYKWYGARGITICSAWIESFEAFYADMGDPPSDAHTLERCDVNDNYEVRNCTWATQEEQCNNKRTNVFVEFEGRRQTLAQWAKELALPRMTLAYRHKKGWSTKEILFGRV